MTSPHQLVGVATIIMLLTMFGCTDSPPTDTVMDEPPGFTATVSGAVDGRISGLGVVTYIAPQVTAFGTRPGYFLIANVITPEQDVKDWMITFRVPDGTPPGTYQLESVDPSKVGEAFEARVEGVLETRTVSFRSNTEGTLTLDSFPADDSQLSDVTIKGNFQFSSENGEGEVVSVNGAFDFPVKA